MTRRLLLTPCLLAVWTLSLVAAEEPQDREALQRRILQQFDANQNGRLDPDERQAAQKALRDRFGKQAGAGKAAGRQGQGKAGQQRGPFYARLLKQFDANNNGRLDPDEIQRARAQSQQLRQRFGAKDKQGGARPGGRKKGAQKGGPNRPNRQQLMQRFDENKNGRLDPPELAKLQQAFQRAGGRPGFGQKKAGANQKKRLPGNDQGKQGNPRAQQFLKNPLLLQRFDENKNGKLDPAEIAKLRQQAGNRRGGRFFAGGQPTAPRKNRVDRSSLLEQFDVNKNGKLDDDERAKALAAMKKN